MNLKSKLHHEVLGEARVIHLSGSINAQNSAEVQERVTDAAGSWEESTVVLALGKVDYVSSAALRVFMELWKAAQAGGSQLVLAEPSAEVREVLELTGFQNLFRIADSVEAAVG